LRISRMRSSLRRRIGIIFMFRMRVLGRIGRLL
jgi:hypothetical protein